MRGWCQILCLSALTLTIAAQQPSPGEAEAIQALRAQRYEEALASLEGLLQRHPNDPRLWTLRGMALSGLGRPAQSIASYEEALKRQSDYLPALQGAADVEFRTGRPQARERLERIVLLEPDNRTAQAMLGELAYRRRDCPVAVRYFDKSGDAVEADPVVLRHYAHCLFVVRRPAEAAPAFRRLVSLRPDDDALRYNLGLSLFEAGRHTEAAETLLPLVSESQPEPDVLSLLADAQRAALDTPGAVATLQKSIRLYPRGERFYLQLAELCMEHSSYDLGLEVTEIGVKNLPDSSSILTMHGILLAQLGFYEKAEAAFEQAAFLDPGEQAATLSLSLTLQRTGRVEESIDVLRDRVRNSPEDEVAAFFLGQALIRKGITPKDEEFVEARSALERSAAALPNEASPRVELGKLYLKEGQVQRAIEVLGEAVELAPSNRRATYQLMIALRRAGRNKEAADLASQVRQQLQRDKQDEVRRNRYRLVKSEP
ncbi:MAG: tetratricopeptide repeat protein [Acidimicrobiia bacterium]